MNTKRRCTSQTNKGKKCKKRIYNFNKCKCHRIKLNFKYLELLNKISRIHFYDNKFIKDYIKPYILTLIFKEYSKNKFILKMNILYNKFYKEQNLYNKLFIQNKYNELYKGLCINRQKNLLLYMCKYGSINSKLYGISNFNKIIASKILEYKSFYKIKDVTYVLNHLNWKEFNEDESIKKEIKEYLEI